MSTPDPLIPEAALPANRPWFLREPSTHPEARPLARRAAALLGGPGGGCVLDVDALRLERWPTYTRHILPGLGAWWHNKCVLLATLKGDVWLYHPGDWEAELLALHPPSRGFALTDEELARMPPAVPTIDAGAETAPGSLQPLCVEPDAPQPSSSASKTPWEHDVAVAMLCRCTHAWGDHIAVIDVHACTYCDCLNFVMPAVPTIDAEAETTPATSAQTASPAGHPDAPAMPSTTPAWTGSEQLGHVVVRQGAQQDIVDASGAQFRRRPGYQRQRVDGAK